jgi:predicted transcriptional regulator
MKRSAPQLSRRERQILDILYRLGTATAAEVTRQMHDAPTYTTVRGLLRVLETKGHIKHEMDGVRYVYSPVVSKSSAGTSVLTHVVRTFFNGSPSAAMAELIGSSSKMSDDELRRLARLIEQARKER